MIRIEGRFEVRLISSAAFAQYMKHRGFTVRTLAEQLGCSPALIGHLRSGARKTCEQDRALKIERLLDAPKGSLFVPHVSHVAREVMREKSPAA